MSAASNLFQRIRGQHSLRRSRFHNKLGQPLAWSQGLRHAPLSFWTAFWAKLNRPLVYPWLPFEAQRRIDRLLQPDAVCLEYGSGLSTLWLASRCARLYSVEDDPAWFVHISRALGRGSQHVQYELRQQPAAYAAFPADADLQVDFALVDGSQRATTVRRALALLKPGGWLFLDDTDRRHHDADNAASLQALRHYAQAGGSLTYLDDFVAHEFRVRQGVLFHNNPGGKYEYPATD